ncbi:response regulator [Roseomonas sp. HJA6]|uniref:histidine kinase n=1 Tax=Roseomonas alba TaxID=2846776 RepID=A0ABS7AEI7_9PROT|nr:response regulator [Neoroseomonas alba]
MLIAAVVLPALLFIFLIRQDTETRRENLQEQGAIATMLAREQTLRLFDSGLLALDRAEDATGSLTWAQIQSRRAAVQADLNHIKASQAAAVASLALVRPDGRIAVASGADPPPGLDTGALDALRVAREGRRGISFEPAPAELRGQEGNILIGRSRAADGRPFDGALLVTLRADALLEAWQRAANQPGGRFALLRDDGAVLLRQDASPAMPAALEPGDPLLRAFGSRDRQARPLTGDPFHDGQAQLILWRRVGDLPLRIVYTVPARIEQRMALASLAVSGIICLGAGLLLALLAVTGRRRVLRDQQTLARLEANAADLRAEIARREAAEEGLRAAQRMEGLGRLTGGVAHDFNNLLTAILGTVRALERHLGARTDERTRRLLSAAVAAVDRGARLNASLLAFARRQPLVLATVDANALVQDFRPLLRRALDESVSLELSLDHRLPPCRADAAQLEAALLNLAINARDAMPRGGAIRIVTRRAWLQEQALAGNLEAQPGPYVAIEVRDTGEGMPADVRDRAFEPFFTTKKDGHGTGLGLSQVFGFVRQIGGHVAIQSTPRRGTTVTLYLPLGSEIEAAANRAAAAAAAAGAAQVSGEGVSVLVVEDEPAVRAVAVEMLMDAGFSVLAAPDGPTALQLLREGVAVDILFSDVVMPGGMSGVDLARESRKLRPGIGVLLASGYAAEALDKHGGAGGFDLISKPYDFDVVLTRINALARRGRGAAQMVGLQTALARRR